MKEEKEKTPVKSDNWFRVNGIERTEEEFCQFIQDQIREHPVVKTQHGKWKELIEWREGNQFTKWSEDRRAVVPVNLVARKKMVVVNLMKPLVETIEGKINFFHKIVGVPNSSEAVDIHGAAVATRLLDYNDYINDSEKLMEEIKYDLFNTGNACKKWYFDKSTYGYMAPREGGKINTSARHRIPGEVVGEVVPIFNIRPDPTAKTIEKCRWFIEIKEVTIQDILDTYKVAPEKLSLETEEAGGYAQKYIGMNEPVEEKDKNEKTRIVAEFWERPSKWYPRGRFIVTTDNIVLHAGDNPNPEHDLPYFMYYYHKTPYSFWAKGPLHFIQDIQREFNRMISIISEHIEAWRPKMTVGQGALKNKGSMTVDSFEIVEVDYSRGEPKPMQMPQLQPQVMEFRDFLVASVDRVSNIHEVSYARLPQYASRAPASLYSMMLEQENIKLGPMVARWNDTIVKEAAFRLKLMDKYYEHPRLVKIMGPNKRTQIEYFSRADLAQNFDVRLEIGVTLNQSTTVQLRSLLEFYDKGIITDKNKIIRAANLGIAEMEFRSDVVDSERAMRENQAFQDGNYKSLKKFSLPPKFQILFEQMGLNERDTSVYMHDDHNLHIQMHTDLLKTEDAERWPDENFKALDRHILVHLLYLMAESQMEQAEQKRPAPVAQAGEPGMPGRPAEEGPVMGPEIEAGAGQIPPPEAAL